VAGVSVYRDNFRVLPFGETGDDWLGLDRRRVQNPTLRVSNNQVIGHVFISADANPELRDQSNREGLISGSAYDDLRVMVVEALARVEARRYEARRHEDAPRPSTGSLFSKFDISGVRSAVAAEHPDSTQLLALVDAKNAELQKGVEDVQRVLSQYSRLATLGTLIDRVVHDGRTAVTSLKNLVRFRERELASATLSDSLKIQRSHAGLRDMKIQADLLAGLFNQIEPFSGRRRGRPRTLSLKSIVNDALSVLAAEAHDLSVKTEVRGQDLDVRVDAAELITVIVNLVQNSLYWLRTVDAPDRIVRIDLARDQVGVVSIVVSDSGPGVPTEARERIFDPYYSRRPNGVGLGLSIAGDIADVLYGGRLELLEEGPLPGATFKVTLRKRV
jgi:C4-dicarboxylate-specific signal transduction histidine kinase